jgi:acyl-CoA synthetase (AMP-forming)/AMP-acid ligase II/acyl carrier protein
MSVVAQLSDWTSVATMLECNAERYGSNTAILGEGGVCLSHRELYARIVSMVQALNHLGIGRDNRVAIVLPPGPDLALAFLAVAAGATSAPLNHSYLQKDFEFYLRDCSARALFVLRGDDSPARAAAEILRVPVIELTPLKEGGGVFDSLPSGHHFAGADDIALVLHTSGTTSRPKRVPLSHQNICASARNIAATLQLQPNDISLSVMPLFHIHGLACLLAAIGAGGSCVCAPSFRPDQFSIWLESWKPTWISAVPTMLQAYLDLPLDSFRAGALRFIRSSSAALPSTVLDGLERLFRVPVIESYGMTEAAHQMASNRLPPHARKPGSVGLPAGPQVAILDAHGAPSLGVGEVCVMGPNVTRGYEDNPEANAAAFCSGWFRTGDQGYFDEDGYLFITGRLKEQINRGGEKIAPREIDEALLAYPAVRQAVAFAVPHSSLGEDIAAAVVLRADSSCSEAALRTFLLDRIPAFKVPTRIIFVDDVPKGPTGKVQRIGLADRLAQFLALVYEPPVTQMEECIAKTIEEVLGREGVGRQDNFFALGGDSLRATQVLTRLQQTLAIELPVPLLFRLPTAALLGTHLDQLIDSRATDMLAAALAALPPEEQARLLDEALLPPRGHARENSDST